jgi:hypothetical protein
VYAAAEGLVPLWGTILREVFHAGCRIGSGYLARTNFL